MWEIYLAISLLVVGVVLLIIGIIKLVKFEIGDNEILLNATLSFGFIFIVFNPIWQLL